MDSPSLSSLPSPSPLSEAEDADAVPLPLPPAEADAEVRFSNPYRELTITFESVYMK